MQLTIGKREFTWPSAQLGELRDCNDLLNDRDTLKQRMADDGYLLVRGLADRDTVMGARRVVVDFLDEQGRIAPGTDPMDAIPNPENPKGGFFGGKKNVTHHPDMLKLLEGESVMRFYNHYFGEEPMTYNYKWLRAMEKGGASNAHYDVVYMGRGTVDHLCTMWTPLGDVPLTNGPLALCVGSHREDGFRKLHETYGKMDVDRDRVQGWFSDDPLEITEKFGGQWCTTEFHAGDVLIFGMLTMHGSVANEQDRFRISSDTRYQPASAPVDERWVGEKPKGHYAWNSEPEKNVSMEEARAQWGV